VRSRCTGLLNFYEEKKTTPKDGKKLLELENLLIPGPCGCGWTLDMLLTLG
jgi:hypothetical protein